MNVCFVAHRGDCQHHIENTLGSVQAALDGDVKAIEIDVQLTKDGIPILFHDRSLKRLFSKEGAIADFNYQTIKNISFNDESLNEKSSEQRYISSLSSLVNLMQTYPKIKLFIEVKRINFCYFSYQYVYEKIMTCMAPILSQVVLISFSYRFLRLCKKISNQPVGYVLPAWQQYNTKLLSLLSPEYLFSNIKIIPDSHNFNFDQITWVPYEIKSPEVANQFIARGASYLETFFPVKLAQQLKGADQLSKLGCERDKLKN